MIAVAIDGPAGAGKSAIARKAAKALGFLYVDTGALYRALGLYVLSKGTDPCDASAVHALLKGADVRLEFRNGEQRVLLCDEDVTDRIRTEEVSMASSKVSAYPDVRRFLLALQRSLAHENNVIMDGRDIGTVVLPDAQIKLFLTASPEERARRRYEEMVQNGHRVSYESVLEDMKKRDYNDTHRAEAPLRPAKDAAVVDTTGNTFEQSVNEITGIIRKQLNQIQK